MKMINVFLRIFLVFFEYFSFFYIVFQKPFRTFTRHRIESVGVILFTIFGCIVTDCNLEKIFLPFTGLIFLIFLILYNLFDLSITEMIPFAIGQWLIITLMEMLLRLGMVGLEVTRSFLENSIMLLITVFLWMYYFIIGRKLNKKFFQMSIGMWYMLDIIIFTITAMMEFFAYIVSEMLSQNELKVIGRCFLIIIVVLQVVFLFVMIYCFNKNKELEVNNYVIECQNEQQKQYFMQLLQKEHDTRCFRHDIINDFLEIQNYCKKQQYDKLENYLDTTLNVIQNISRSNYDVGNDIINTILNYYLQPLKEKYDIEVNGYVHEIMVIDERDLCVVVSNIIKNAVEAVGKLEKGKIIFSINVGKFYLSIRAVNSFDGTIKFDKDHFPRTNKQNRRNHGLGLENMRRIVEKYSGQCRIAVNAGNYQIEVCLKICRE